MVSFRVKFFLHSVWLCLLQTTLYGGVPCSTEFVAPPGTTVWTISNEILSGACVGNPITQSMLPLTISAPGLWSFANDLTWSDPTTAAITIDISAIPIPPPIIINLACHSLSVGTSSVGIDAATPTAIVNGTLISRGGSSLLATGYCLQIENVTFASTVSNVSIDSGDVGFAPNNSNTCLVKNCQFNNVGTAIEIIDSTGLTIESCTFGQQAGNCITSNTGLDQSIEVVISNCEFANATAPLNLTGVEAWTIEHCIFSNFSLTPIITINNSNFITINNCQINRGSHSMLNNTITFNNVNNINITNTTINGGNAQSGILGTGIGNNVTISNVLVNNCNSGIDLSGITSSTGVLVKSCSIVDCSNGLSMPPFTIAVLAVNNCVVNATTAAYTNVTPAALIATGGAAIATATYWVNTAI
jgi:hypothetical protein